MSENTSDFEKKLMSVLSNPEALSGIMSLAKNFTQSNSSNNSNNNSNTQPPVVAAEAVPTAVTANAPINTNGFTGRDLISEKSIGLLIALKPFLSNNKCEKIDAITQVLRVALLTDLLK